MDYLKDVGQDKSFYFKNGSQARNLYELVQIINSLNEKDFSFHCNTEHDDFANWIGGSVGDIELSQKLRKIKDKEKYLKLLNDHISKVEKRNRKKDINRQFSSKVKELISDYGHVWLVIFIMIMTSIFTAMIYFQYHSLMNIKTLDEKINYLESRNTCYNNFFNEQIFKTREYMENVSLDNYCVYNLSLSINPPDSVLEQRPAFFSDDDITLEEGILTINAGQGAYIAYFDNTSSMLPALNHLTRAIEVKPREDNMHIGDIISYDIGQGRVAHRIVDIGSDEQGRYYITKGDNNNAVDEKVRFENVKGKVVVLIY